MKPDTLREQIAADERELIWQLKAQAQNASLGVTIAHRIDELRSSIDKKRAVIRRIENAAEIVGRRTGGPSPANSNGRKRR